MLHIICLYILHLLLLCPPSPSIPVIIADDTFKPLAGVGSIVTPHLSLPNVYLVPKLTLNLDFVG